MKGHDGFTLCKSLIDHCFKITVNCRLNWDQPQSWPHIVPVLATHCASCGHTLLFCLVNVFIQPIRGQRQCISNIMSGVQLDNYSHVSAGLYKESYIFTKFLCSPNSWRFGEDLQVSCDSSLQHCFCSRNLHVDDHQVWFTPYCNHNREIGKFHDIISNVSNY